MKVHAHKVRVTLGPAARGKVWIDEQEVPNVARVIVTGAAGEPSSVVLELTAVDVELQVADEQIVDELMRGE